MSTRSQCSFVKNCEKRFNTKQCGTVNIGTLELYRETGEEQIADVEEGFFSLSVDFNDIDVQKSWLIILLIGI